MNKDNVPENFSISLVILDIIPVLFFALSSFFIAYKIHSKLFTFGALLCFCAGFCKVLWKFIVVVAKKNIRLLFVQLRFFMPLGFVFMIISIILFRNQIDWKLISNLIFSLPQIIFFPLGILGMIFMGIFAFTLDSKDLKSNWIEEITNGLSQIFIFLGIVFSAL